MRGHSAGGDAVGAGGIHEILTDQTTYQRFKRCFDVAVAAFLCLMLAPVFLLVALAILIEDGRPVFFLQDRIGMHHRPFKLCKFRSMRVEADERVHRAHVQRAINGHCRLRLEDDPRVTRVGQALRRWSIDELPNLLNVIKGDMSLVGPRPLVPYETASISERYVHRFAVHPGVTGLAQVSGRLDITHEERLRLDIAYAQNRSLRTDLRIIAKTLPSLLASNG